MKVCLRKDRHRTMTDYVINHWMYTQHHCTDAENSGILCLIGLRFPIWPCSEGRTKPLPSEALVMPLLLTILLTLKAAAIAGKGAWISRMFIYSSELSIGQP
ncbi:hypothetical protein GIB67_031854 [Kingdonia uniflora]|uniref:Uncharacterized protein n=1 Tax=Kingdonia uniflora TaxID=39325 RepID=A0A7J7L4L9_9MAGN|nr:hypothetical protein GIB67_031854 [Kingdonia uniflora]